MNRGKAYLENGDSSLATQAFEEAVRRAPNSAPALRNLARSHLMARDLAPLTEVLERARALEPDSVATLYLRGLGHARLAEFERAIVYLEEVVRLDPHTAAPRFQLANAYQATGRHEKAAEQFRATSDLDPFHAAAHYRLSVYARDAGDAEEFERRSREFKRLKNLFGEESLSAEPLEACVYTRAEPALAAAPRALMKGRGDGVRFRDATHEMIPDDFEHNAPAVAATVLDVDESGRYTLFVAFAEGGASLLAPGADGAFRATPLDLELSGAMLSSERLVGLAGSLEGGFDLETPEYPAPQMLNDLMLVGDKGARLLKRTGPRAFEDVTADAGLAGLKGNAARWIDYDHDGDIDLVVGGESGLTLWQNGFDGRFEDVTHSVGITETRPIWDVMAVDLDSDVAVDLVVARGVHPTRVFENRRIGKFAAQPEPPGPWPAARRILIDDLDNDGHFDVVLIGEEELSIVPGRGGARHRIGLAGMEVRTAALIDFDNDGWLDLILAGAAGGGSDAGRLVLWRNDGAEGWHDASAETDIDSISLAKPKRIAVADLDADGDSDLLLITEAGLRTLRNEGGNAGGQLKIRLVGTKSNPSGIGTRVEVRAGTFWAVRSVSQLPIEIGLGDSRQLDSVQTVWTNGVVENEIQVTPSAEPLTIVEKMIAAGSCPFLYAWDGREFRFVTDLLGNSPLGLSLRRGVMLPSDPDELVWIGDSASFAPRDGHYILQVTDEMREVLYLDQARLVVAEHAPGIEVHPTDRLMPRDDGIDRTRAVGAIDGEFAPPGLPLASNLRGQTHPLTLTLDFGPLEDMRAPVLALTGWLQYGDASTNIALSQGAGEIVVPTTLEMESMNGSWEIVDVTVGTPAGKTKTIVIDLRDKLAPGVRRLRLRTSFELRWDRIALFERLPESALKIHTMKPTDAQIQWRGFSDIRARAVNHPTTPDWYTVFERPPWRTTPEGWVTRFGDVWPLVTQRDANLVLLNGGDALELLFAVSDLPPLERGRTRTYFFYSVGWDKDGDYNVVSGDRVEPMPVVAEDDDWRIRYNTRWVSKDWPTTAP
ncbi:MAG: VCBS repeat-containing protein [Deltaproteobacteria bacterium]|nr:VCBS repeat-containing protein [Deltaproteobacteria bacterium]